eukprot:TRINITY_DN13085_c0_g1_i3.p1 TRINITY_DN13085_c0_g1~~TRINITY_DN13085_c0_g1_i3.p1  ORF type:complete len:890 (-),score=111.63 TRINITY_DN13085_c0_g1_i3:130-2799(-)
MSSLHDPLLGEVTALPTSADATDFKATSERVQDELVQDKVPSKQLHQPKVFDTERMAAERAIWEQRVAKEQDEWNALEPKIAEWSDMISAGDGWGPSDLRVVPPPTVVSSLSLPVAPVGLPQEDSFAHSSTEKEKRRGLMSALLFRCDTYSLSGLSRLNVGLTVLVRMTFPVGLLFAVPTFCALRHKLPGRQGSRGCRACSSFPRLRQFFGYAFDKGYLTGNPFKPLMMYIAILIAHTRHEHSQSFMLLWEAWLPLFFVVCSQIAIAAEFEPDSPEQVEMWRRKTQFGADCLATALDIHEKDLRTERTLSSVGLQEADLTLSLEKKMGAIPVPAGKVRVLRAACALCRSNDHLWVPLLFLSAYVYRMSSGPLFHMVGVAVAIYVAKFVRCLWRRVAFNRIARHFETADDDDDDGKSKVSLYDVLKLLIDTFPRSECDTLLLDSQGWFVYANLQAVGLTQSRGSKARELLNETWAAFRLYQAAPLDRAFFRRMDVVEAMNKDLQVCSRKAWDLREEFGFGQYRQAWRQKAVPVIVLAKQLLIGVPYPQRRIQRCCRILSLPAIIFFRSVMVAVIILFLYVSPSALEDGFKLTDDKCGLFDSTTDCDPQVLYVHCVWFYAMWPSLIGIIRRFDAFERLAEKVLDMHINLNTMLSEEVSPECIGLPAIGVSDAWGLLLWAQCREFVLSSVIRRMGAYDLMLGWVVLVYLSILLILVVHFIQHLDAFSPIIGTHDTAPVQGSMFSEWGIHLWCGSGSPTFCASLGLLMVFSGSFMLLTSVFFAPVMMVGMRINRMLKEQVTYVRSFELECASCIGILALGLRIENESGSGDVRKEEVEEVRDIARSLADFMQMDGGQVFRVLGFTMTGTKVAGVLMCSVAGMLKLAMYVQSRS